MGASRVRGRRCSRREAEEPSSQWTSSNTTTVGRSWREAGEEEAGGPVDLAAHGLAVQVSDLLGEVLGHWEAEEGGEIGEDLRASPPRREPSPVAGELGPALGFGVVALDACVLLDDLEEAASS